MAKRNQPTKREVAEENRSAWTRFFRETKMEMKKVIWPTKQEMIRYTIAVIVSVILVSFLIIIVDFIFMQLSKLLVHTVG